MKEGWEIKKLGEVCSIGDGNYSSKYPKASEFVSKGVPFLTATNLKNGTIVPEGIRYISKEQHLTLTKGHVIKNDLVIVVRGSSTGNNSIVSKDYDGSNLNSQLAFLRVKDKRTDSRYLFTVFNSPDIQKIVLNNISGSAQPQLPNNKLLNIEIPLPPLPEQQRIIAILDEAFAAIVKAKANAEKNLNNAKALFESYLQSVFDNKGEGWEEKKLKEIGVAQTGTTPKTAHKENYGDFIPFIKPADIDIIGNGEIRYDNDGLSEQGLNNGRKMLKGSILMVCIGATIGKVGIVDRDVSCNQQINSLTVNKEFSPKFIYYALSTKKFFDHVIQNSAQATLPIINKGKWETLTVSYPKSKAQQKTIVRNLDALSTETKKLETIYQKKINDLEELKKSVLQKAFNGELTTKKLLHEY